MKTIEKKLIKINSKFLDNFPRISNKTKKRIFEAVMASKDSFPQNNELVSISQFINGSSSRKLSYSNEWIEYWKFHRIFISGNFTGPNSDVPEFIILWNDGTMTKSHCGEVVTWKTTKTIPMFELDFHNN